MAAPHLVELACQVRGSTLDLLSAVPEQCLLWAPQGTSNHILWHAGHALWVQDVLFIELVAGRSELPQGWAETFGMDCRPVQETNRLRAWPSRKAIDRCLREQLDRLFQLLGEVVDTRLAFDAPCVLGSRNLLSCFVHAWHDEAKHQGEMYLLFKQWRSRSASNLANS
jgi:hypothetical protein